jgi:hypothetical protein
LPEEVRRSWSFRLYIAAFAGLDLYIAYNAVRLFLNGKWAYGGIALFFAATAGMFVFRRWQGWQLKAAAWLRFAFAVVFAFCAVIFGLRHSWLLLGLGVIMSLYCWYKTAEAMEPPEDAHDSPHS